MRSRLRFIIAIGLAVVLGAWLAWTSLGGSLETYAGPGEIAAATDKTYRLNGRVAPGAPADAAAAAQSASGLRFTVVNKQDPTSGCRCSTAARSRTSSRTGARWWSPARAGRDVRGPQRLAHHALPVQVQRPPGRHGHLSRGPSR